MARLSQDQVAKPQVSGLSKDLVSGFVVFLLALPLSIGIALASGFPLMSGLLAAAIGGLVVGPLTGSPVSIKGPAAGMIVIMLGAVEELGAGNPQVGVQAALAALVLVGCIQMVLGKLKVTEISKAFPESVVKGMLAAIGVIIISKQFHIMVGNAPHGKTPPEMLMELPSAILHANPEIAVIGLATCLLMFFWPKIMRQKRFALLAKVPGPLVAVSLAIGASIFFDISLEHQYSWLGKSFKVGPQFLVHVPDHLASALIFPNFGMIGSAIWWKWVFMIGSVASLESVLSVKAVDAIDPEKRKSDSAKDLFATGVGNTLCGLIGGLPIITEIVRSSANINAGAKSRWSNVFHGLFIVLFVVGFPALINLIPLSSLAGLLVFTGYNLASPTRWRQVLFSGKEQFVVFFITMIMTLLTDLLMGIAIGLICECVINAIASGNIRYIFKPTLESQIGKPSSYEEDFALVTIASPIVFTNLIKTLKFLEKIDAKKIIVDLSNSSFIDHTSMSALAEVAHEDSEHTKIILKGYEQLASMGRHPHSARVRHKNLIAKVFLSSSKKQNHLE